MAEGEVATVCGSEVRIYGTSDGRVRPFIRMLTFSNYGKARQYAIEYEEKQRNKIKPDPEVRRKSRKQLKGEEV